MSFLQLLLFANLYYKSYISNMFKVILYSTLLIGALCTLGVDLSTVPTVEALKCLRQSGHTFLIGRAYRSYASFDANIIQTIANTQQAGYTANDVGVYMFPCYSTTKTPEAQAAQMLAGLQKVTPHYSSIWIDMQTNTSPGCGWSKDYDANCLFTSKLVQAVQKSNKKVGIYASIYMWGQIFGGSDKCAKYGNLPLWYAHYDGVTNFSDFKPFGGWTKPYAKQYKGTTALCNASVDLNYKQ